MKCSSAQPPLAYETEKKANKFLNRMCGYFWATLSDCGGMERSILQFWILELTLNLPQKGFGRNIGTEVRTSEESISMDTE